MSTLEERARDLARLVTPDGSENTRNREYAYNYILSALREAREEGIEEALALVRARQDQLQPLIQQHRDNGFIRTATKLEAKSMELLSACYTCQTLESEGTL